MSVRFLPLILGWTIASMTIGGCQPVPANVGGGKTEPLRPVKPLWDKSVKITETRKDQPTRGFKVADVTAAKAATKAKPGTKPKPGAPPVVDNAAIGQALQAAEDKAASAQSMEQSAQTKDDWNLVFGRWKQSIAMLKAIPGKSPQVQQKVAEYQKGLENATQLARVSLDPSLAPVDSVGANGKGVIGVPADKPAEKPGDKPADKPADKPGDKSGDKPAEKSVKPAKP